MLSTELSDRLANLELSDWLLLIVAPFIGSFLGVLIRRLPESRPIGWARSTCDACGATLSAGELLPLVSWLWLGGRCRHCGHLLGWFYPGIELGAAAVAAISIIVDGAAQAWLDCLLGWWLLTLAWIDLRHWVLPDLLTLPLLILGLVAAAAWDPNGLADRAAAVALGYIALRGIAWAYRRLRRREGLGEGDAKLFGAAGAWLGTAALPQVVLLAALAALAAAAGAGLAGIRLRTHSALPFGPFLAVAIWIIWLFGPMPV